MAMAESLPPDASTASTGLGIRYIVPDRVYAFSGAIPLNNETKTALEFTTGAGVCSVLFYHSGRFAYIGSNKAIEMKISFNDNVVIFTSRLTSATSGYMDMDPIPAIIPPFTVVKVEVISDDTGSIANFISMTGRVYGAA